MTEDEKIEIGARALFDDWQAARGQLYGHKAMKWDHEPHHQKRFRSQFHAVLAALRKAGLVLVPVEPDMDMGLRGAEEVNRQMRGPAAMADYDAAMDCYRAMILAATGDAP